MKFINFRFQPIYILLTVIFLFSLDTGLHIYCQTEKIKIKTSSSDQLLLNNLSKNSPSNSTYPDFNPWIIFKYFGNKTFVCILYLFFQVNGFLLFFTSVGIQIFLTYITVFLNLSLFQYVPIQIFETVAVLFYCGFSLGIIYTVMFGNSKAWNNNPIKKKPREFLDHYEEYNFSYYISKIYEFPYNFLDEFFKIFGLIFISYLIQNDEYDNIITPSTTNISQGNNWINFGTECLMIIISSLIAILIATLMNYKFHVNCNLWLGSLIFLLMGTEICVKLLSRT
jgi:hypothetical protein